MKTRTNNNTISSLLYKTVILACIVFLINVYFNNNISAAATVYGRITDQQIYHNDAWSDIYRGYFHNQQYTSGSGDKVLPTYSSKSNSNDLQFGVGGSVVECTTSDGENKSTVLSENDVNYTYAIPECIDSPVEFVNFLRNKNSVGGGGYNDIRRKIGTAYIVQSILGRNGPGYSSCSTSYYCDISNADFVTVQTLLTEYNNASLIEWNIPLYSDGLDSMFGLTKDTHFYDIFAFEEYVTRNGINIKNSGGTSLYKIWRFCANPIGSLKGLEPLGWAINPSVSVRSDTSPSPSMNTTVYENGNITWVHAVDNTKATKATVNVVYGATNPPGYSAIDAVNRGTLMAGTQNALIESTFWVNPANFSPGDKICRATAIEKSSNTSGWASSGIACATVIAFPSEWSLDMSTKVQKTSPAGVSSGFVDNITDAKPGDTLSWQHTIKNTGPDATDLGVSYNYSNNAALSVRTLLVNGMDQYINSGFAVNDSVVKKSYYWWSSLTKITVNNNDVGKTFCRRTIVSQKSSSVPAISSLLHLLWYEEPTQACVTVTSPPWQLDVSTQIKKTAENGYSEEYKLTDITDAKPKDKITWKHTIKNGNQNVTNTDVRYGYINEEDLTLPNGPTRTINSGFAKNAVKTEESGSSWANSLEITQDDVGKKYCRNTVVDQISSIDAKIPSFDLNTWYKGPASLCVTIPYNYTLLPTVTDITPTVTGYDIKSVVDNNEGPTKSKPTYWQLTRLVNNTAPAGFLSGQDGGISGLSPCINFTGADSCIDVSHGIGVDFAVDLNLLDYSDPYSPIGFPKVCYVLSVKSHNQDSPGDWRHSAPKCVELGKKPKVQVWGGDVWSKGDIKMGTTLTGGVKYGSWGEYALFSGGLITEMASKSIFTNLGAPTLCDFSPLSFTNVDCVPAVGTVGNYASTRNLPDISASYPLTTGTVLSGDYDVSTLSGRYIGNGTDISLHGTVASGQTIIINAPTSDVKISNNINYPNDTITDIANIPQLLIIAKNINILSNVQNIDAWLLAKDGTINTCSDIPLTSMRIYDSCNNKLTVNGPVVAKKLLLHRTYGSDPIPSIGLGTPAEIFNLRADAYLWAAAQSSGGNTIKTVYSVDQPPRF